MRGLLGAALMTLAWTLAGVHEAAGLRARARTVGELRRFAELLGFELARFAPPMPELLEKLSRTAPGAGGALARRLRERLPALGDVCFEVLWEESLEKLRGPEREALAELGRVLGRYGGPEEIAAAGACAQTLARIQEEAERTAREKGRLAVSLAAAAGATAAVLML